MGLSRKKGALGNARVCGKALKEFLHEHPKRKQYSPFPCAQKKYGKEAQMIEDEPESPPLSKGEQTFIQTVTG